MPCFLMYGPKFGVENFCTCDVGFLISFFNSTDNFRFAQDPNVTIENFMPVTEGNCGGARFHKEVENPACMSCRSIWCVPGN